MARITNRLIGKLGHGEQTLLAGAHLGLMDSTFESGQAKGLEQVFPSAQAGVGGFDRSQNGFAIDVGKFPPGSAERRLAFFLTLRLCLDVSLALEIEVVAPSLFRRAFGGNGSREKVPRGLIV
jgi:hypothetical protein